MPIFARGPRYTVWKAGWLPSGPFTRISSHAGCSSSSAGQSTSISASWVPTAHSTAASLEENDT